MSPFILRSGVTEHGLFALPTDGGAVPPSATKYFLGVDLDVLVNLRIPPKG